MTAVQEFDLDQLDVRALNRALHASERGDNRPQWRVVNPNGCHSVAVGLNTELEVEIDGHVGYYCAGMNQHATVTIYGNAGPGVAENIMSGVVHIKGNASQYAGASGHGGLLLIDGDASSRCGISMKGIDIVVKGSVGHMSAFMAQTGNLVVCGDAGSDLGDSIYEATLYVRGDVAGLGADCIEKDMTAEHRLALDALLALAEAPADAGEFRRYGSERRLYHFNVDHADDY
jgi:glutamate synthase domain-containing protein 3